MLPSASRKRAGQKETAGRGGKRGCSEESEEVEVVCRLTPYKGNRACLAPIDDTNLKCVAPPDVRRRDGSYYPDKVFEFGYVFDENDGQQSVFNRCAVDLIQDVVCGKNALLFTYGVTGSGKTYTMTGKPTVDGTGILPRTLDVIFNSIENKTSKCVFQPTGRNAYIVRSKLEAHLARKKLELDRLQISNEVENRFMERLSVPGYCDDYVCSVFVSYIEIYNNYCYDLLESKDELTKRDIRSDARGATYVDGACEIEVDNSDEALEVFCRGEERRRTSNTLLNKESSRSHSVFTVRLVMAPIKEDAGMHPDDDPSKVVVSQLCLVDLAGSERAKRTKNVGDRLAEAGNINKSLMVLRQCIDKLRKNQRSRVAEPIPYRDSKLTQLFKNYFECGGRIRMIICANPKPDDFEENLNVLAFAEESQSVRVVRGDNRLEADENRPPVPRRFYAKWNSEMDEVVSAAESAAGSSFNLALPPYSMKDYNDSTFALRWKNYFTAVKSACSKSLAYSEDTMSQLEPTLMKALCVGDYFGQQVLALSDQREKDSRTISELTAQNKHAKRELHSMGERLRRYEENDEEALENEERMRRSMKEERTRLRKQEKTLQTINNIIDGVSTGTHVTPVSHTPSVAQLRSRFADYTESKHKRMMTASSTQLSAAAPSDRRPPRDNGHTPLHGPGYFNPKYHHRRSKSAPRILDHQPAHRVPTGGILKNRLPPSARQVTNPSADDLHRSTDYVLTHQEVDDEGNISTSVVKGNVIPTAGGGTAVLFNDVERLTHENLKTGPASLRR